MNDRRPSAIGEAPSLADITSADDRVGKVDFTAKLGNRMDPAAEETDEDLALTSMVRPQRPSEHDGDADDAERMPFILPPAKVDSAMAAEAERTKLEIAAARGELPEDDADEEAEDTDEVEDTAGAEPAESVTAPAVSSEDVPEAPGVELEKPSGPPEGLVIKEVADLDEVAAEVAHDEVVEADRADAEEVARLEAETEAARRAAEEALARAAEIEAGELDLDGLDGLDGLDDLDDEDDDLFRPDDAPLRSVTEVASAVIAAMNQINEAHVRHVEALELETARRCELLTAQAELDAELIRLHARREAHAIISAARTRSGDHDAEQVEPDQLGEIGETFSRFAETIETTVATGPESPDHLRKS